MRSCHAFRLVVVLLGLAGLSSRSAPAGDDQQRYLRLHQAPITLYPSVEIAGTPLVAFVNSRARPDDAIVVSYVDALKVTARVAQLGIERGEVWIYVPGDLDLTQNGRANLEGAKGIVYIPEPARRDHLWASARRVADSATVLGCRMVAGLEPKQAGNFTNVRDLALHTGILTIYNQRRLSQGAAEYRRYVEPLVREARAANPAIQIEVCISTGRDAAATQALAGVLWTCADLIDRIGIYCNDTPESHDSLKLLYEVLRGAS